MTLSLIIFHESPVVEFGRRHQRPPPRETSGQGKNNVRSSSNRVENRGGEEEKGRVRPARKQGPEAQVGVVSLRYLMHKTGKGRASKENRTQRRDTNEGSPSIVFW